MANDEPPYLTVGTDVSAKYKGAFCEAKIKKVNRVVKCKVNFKNNLGSFMVTDDQIKGPLRMGAEIEAKHPEKNQFLEAIINKLQDYSQYTVVFDDGDETTLRRTSLCLKSGRHFAESPTLDQFPLTNPEHFGTPVIGAGKYKRKRRSTLNSSLDYESSDDDSFPRKLKAIRGKERDPDLGKVVCVDYGDRRKKDSWYPGLIVPHPAQSNIKITKDEHLIRSFKDGKYYQVPKRDTREFLKDSLPKIENNALKLAIDKAVLYLQKDELPAHWDKVLFMGLDLPSADEDSQDFDSDSSDDEPSEDKDRFVAQLYKFMDERGTPINKAPSVSNRDLNLYKLFKIMHKLGGYNKVTNQNKWKAVYSKMGLPASNANGPNQIKAAYKRYLQSFEDFYRKLGCTMVNNSRSTRGRHRSDRNFILTRTRDRETSSPKGRNPKDAKDKATSDKKNDDKTRSSDKRENKTEDSPKVEEKAKTPDKKKEKAKIEDEKLKKDDRPRLVRSQSLVKEKKDASPKEEEKKDTKSEKARTREDARKEKIDSPEKKGTRSNSKIEIERKEKEESQKDKKDQSPKGKEKKEEKLPKEKDEKPKDKKDEKIVKDRKIVKEKKVEEKTVKEKNDNSLKDKKEETPVKEKRDHSKDVKEEKTPKGKKEIDKKAPEEKSSPKKKIDKVVKEKKDEKVVRPRRENKSPLPDTKKTLDDSDSKIIKEEKQKKDAEIKKEDPSVKEKSGPKLRDRREDTSVSDKGDDNTELEASDEKDLSSQDGFEKKEPLKCKLEDEESPSKGKKKCMKLSERDEKDNPDDVMSESDDETFTSEQEKEYKDIKREIELGDRVKVKYGRGRLKKVYDAKVLKIQPDGQEKKYFVHYNGWNNRYDEWVRRNFIVALINSSKKQEAKNMVQSLKKIDRGRPPGPLPSKPMRKNSTSSTNSSVSCSRATRSDKKNIQLSPLSSSVGLLRRTRKKSGVTIGLTDTSQDSDSDAEETLDGDEDDDADIEDNTTAPNDCCFKEELFSDDEEKEKMEDVKRDDITELEKAISIEESLEDNKNDFKNSSFIKEESKLTLSIEEVKPNLEEKLLNSEPVIETPKLDIKNIKIESNKSESLNPHQATSSNKLIGAANEEKLKLLALSLEAEKKPILPLSSCEISTPVSNSVNNIIKPTTVLSFSSDIKLEKNLLTLPPKIIPVLSSCVLSSTSNKSEPIRPSYSSNSVSLSDSKSTLNFSGLHGLIQKSSFDRSLVLNKNATKDIASKVDLPKTNLGSKCDFKSESESKSLSSFFRPEKIIPVFGSSSLLNPHKICEPSKSEEKSVPKSNQNVFSLILKSRSEKDQNTECKSIDSTSSSTMNVQKEKPIVAKVSDVKTTKHEPDRTISVTSFSQSIISSVKFCSPKSDSSNDTAKSSFDLFPDKNTGNQDKKPEIKENAFSLSFSTSGISEQHNNANENSSHSKSKHSETVDLSKTIPSILERLKKDVVADLKVPFSPPRQKEELNFDFLRGTQDISKSLSRSESSNSLQICEDMSDTNDSIISKESNEIKKTVLPVTSKTSTVVNECQPDKCPEDITAEKETTIMENCTINDQNSDQNVDESTKAAVIVSPPTEISVEPIGVKNEIKKNEDISLEPNSIPKDDSKEKEMKSEPELKKTDLHEENEVNVPVRPESTLSSVKSDTVVENTVEEQHDNNSTKESLFDDLIKIKSTNIDFSQNSLKESEDKPVIENKDLSVKEESLSSNEDKDQSLDPKDSDTSDSSPEKSTDKHRDHNMEFSKIGDIKSETEDNGNAEDDGSFSLSKKESKKKRFGKKLKRLGNLEGFDKDDKDLKFKDGRSKSKKRSKLDCDDSDRFKFKKLKKNKSKKRLSKHEDLFGELGKKDLDDDNKDLSEKIRRREKRRSEKKFFKNGLKNDFDSKIELKKKKGKKNRDKLSSDKKDFLEKKTKKKKKLVIDDNQDSDSEKESIPKSVDKKKKKERKKFKSKDCSSSDDAGEKSFKEQSKILNSLPSSSNSLMRQDSKSDDPDMSFLLCKEKVPASPVDHSSMVDYSSGLSAMENSRMNADMNMLPLPNMYPCMDSIDSADAMSKHNIHTSAVLDNTPPTTPSSTGSLLSSSPSHERDSFSMNYSESTQSGRDSGEGESDIFRCNSSNRTIARGSEEYHAATTLAFAVCKSVSEKPKEDTSQNALKRSKGDAEEHSPSKRKKKNKRVRRMSESVKSPRHKSRFPKVENFEDSSGASAVTSNSPPYSTSSLGFSRSPHRVSSISEGFSSKYFYVPLHEKDPEKRIALLQEKMSALRKEYMELRAKVIAIDHKRRKARKKMREADAAHANPSTQSEDGQSCS